MFRFQMHMTFTQRILPECGKAELMLQYRTAIKFICYSPGNIIPSKAGFTPRECVRFYIRFDGRQICDHAI